MSNNKTEMNTEYDMDTTWVCEILCKKCNKVLPPHTMSEHLDITNCIHCCETGHLYNPRPAYVDTRKPQRMDMLEKYGDVLRRLIGTGKGSRLRRMFVSEFIVYGNITFTSHDHEYSRIGKFGRQMWAGQYITAFPPQIRDIIIKEIAVAFGAFGF